jgi:hypothetical protein
MSHPYYHARSSAKKWGGDPADYQPIHDWFDATKAQLPDLRHRALRHHSEGIYLCEQVFGTTITNYTGDPVRSRQMSLQSLANLRQQQAASLAYFDVFWLFAVLSLGLVLLVLLMRRSVAEKGEIIGGE